MIARKGRIQSACRACTVLVVLLVFLYVVTFPASANSITAKAVLHLTEETGKPEIIVSWSGFQSRSVTVYRACDNSNFIQIGLSNSSVFIDDQFEYGHEYQYMLVPSCSAFNSSASIQSNKVVASSGRFAVLEAQHVGDKLLDGSVTHNGVSAEPSGDAKVHSTLKLLLENHDVSCSAYISCTLKTLGFLNPDPRSEVNLAPYDEAAKQELQNPELAFANTYITHTPSGCDYSTLDGIMELYGSLSHYKIHKLDDGYEFNDLDEIYKVPGAIYIYDSNIAIYAGNMDNGKIYSFHGDRSQVDDSGVYVAYKWNNGYDFCSKIYAVISPDS